MSCDEIFGGGYERALTCATPPVDKKETMKFRIDLTIFSIFAAVSFN